jgi:HK97 family phage prohead protease
MAANEKKVKNLHLKVKSVNDDGTFTGMGSVFGVVDSYGDIVVKGAFTKTLEEQKGKIRCLWQHDQTQPIGVFTSLIETDEGLQVEGKLTLGSTGGANAYALMQDGAVDGLSIGFQTIQDSFDQQTGIRYIKEVKLWEVSVVTFPANEEATITSVKSAFDTLNQKQAVLVLSFINNLKTSPVTQEPQVASEVLVSEEHSEKSEADKDNADEPQMDLHSLEQLSESLKQLIKWQENKNKEVKNERRN